MVNRLFHVALVVAGSLVAAACGVSSAGGIKPPESTVAVARFAGPLDIALPKGGPGSVASLPGFWCGAWNGVRFRLDDNDYRETLTDWLGSAGVDAAPNYATARYELRTEGYGYANDFGSALNMVDSVWYGLYDREQRAVVYRADIDWPGNSSDCTQGARDHLGKIVAQIANWDGSANTKLPRDVAATYAALSKGAATQDYTAASDRVAASDSGVSLRPHDIVVRWQDLRQNPPTSYLRGRVGEIQPGDAAANVKERLLFSGIEFGLASVERGDQTIVYRFGSPAAWIDKRREANKRYLDALETREQQLALADQYAWQPPPDSGRYFEITSQECTGVNPNTLRMDCVDIVVEYDIECSVAFDIERAVVLSNDCPIVDYDFNPAASPMVALLLHANTIRVNLKKLIPDAGATVIGWAYFENGGLVSQVAPSLTGAGSFVDRGSDDALLALLPVTDD